MKAINNFMDVMNLVSVERQEKNANSFKNSFPKNDFKNFLDNSVQTRKTEKVKQNKPAEKEFESKKVEAQPKEEPKMKEKVEKTDKSDSEDQKSLKPENLSEEDKAVVKEIAEKLGVDQETLLNLLQALNVDLNTLKLNIKDSDINVAADQIKNMLEDMVGKIEQGTADENKAKSLDSKIHLVVNIHNKQVDKTAEKGEKVQVQNIHLNLKATDAENAQKAAAKKGEETGQTNSQAQVINLDDKRESAKSDQAQNQPEQATAKKDTTVKNDDSLGEQLAQDNQQSNQDSNKNGKKADSDNKGTLASIFENAKVVNLKTNTEAVGKDMNLQNVLGIQQPDAPITRASVLKNTMQTVSNMKENVFGQIVEQAKIVLTDKQTEMEMNLKPESLGKLHLKIATENGLVVAKFTAESQQVKEIIESNLAQLKEHLQNQGVAVQEFSVNVGQDSRREMFNNQRFANSNSRINRAQNSGSNTILASEDYVNRHMVRNPYLMSNSSVDFTA